MMKISKKELLFLFFILISIPINATTSIHPLTKARADTLYCPLSNCNAEIYGDMHFHNDSSLGYLIPIQSLGVWVNITGFNGTGGMAEGYTNGFTFSPSLNALICDSNMRVSSWYKVSYGNAGNNQEYQFQLSVNESRQHITDDHRKIGSAGDVGSISGGGSFLCTKGAYISLQARNNDGTANILIHVVTVVLRRIA